MKMNGFHRFCALACVLLMSGFDTTAALNAYLKADGISGDGTVAAYTDHVEVYGYSHEVSSPVDLATGQATGKRQHRPFKFVKQISGNSPEFENAWVRNQIIRSAEFKLLRTNPQNGQVQVYYIYRFTNIRIVSIRDWMPNTLDSGASNYPHLQEISFVYQGIEWQALPDGAIAQDSWNNNQL